MYKVLVWGIGTIARQLQNIGIHAEIMGYIQTKKTQENFGGKPVYCPEETAKVNYDYIIVANSYSDEVCNICMGLGIMLEKVIFLKPLHCLWAGGSPIDREVLKNVLGGEAFDVYFSGVLGMDKDSGFYHDMYEYNRLNKRKSFIAREENKYPIIGDKYAQAGAPDVCGMLESIYFAEAIYRNKVKSHYDIGSRIDGFISVLLAMQIDVTLMDIREFPIKLEHLHFIQADATMLENVEDNSIESLSALSSLEHFGLGRYGDPIAPEACFKCFGAIQRKIKTGGYLYLSVPVGMERVEFNAHRVFYAGTVADSFSEMQLVEFSSIDNNTLSRNIDIHSYDNLADRYCDGLFIFRKK